MTKTMKGGYLAPEIKVIILACNQVIATSDPLAASIENSTENDEIDW